MFLNRHPQPFFALFWLERNFRSNHTFPFFPIGNNFNVRLLVIASSWSNSLLFRTKSMLILKKRWVKLKMRFAKIPYTISQSWVCHQLRRDHIELIFRLLLKITVSPSRKQHLYFLAPVGLYLHPLYFYFILWCGTKL